MSKISESGRYSLAGFLYQIAATAVEGFDAWEHVENDDDIVQVLELEGMGQDLVVKPKNDGVTRLIQYKHSTKNAVVNSNELRTILATFLKCVRATEKNIGDFRFELTTNRDLHGDIGAWSEAKETGKTGELRKCIEKNARSDIEDLDDLCEIFELFSYQKLTATTLDAELNKAAANLGMLEEEIPGGINRLMGFLAKRSDDPGTRRILPSEIRHELTGHANACELLSKKSKEIRSKAITDFQQEESHRPRGAISAPVVARSQVLEINTAIRTCPVVVVYGDGGCGKSIAIADATLNCMQDPAQTPEFCMVERANAFTSQTAISIIASWRRCGTHTDGNTFSNAFRRVYGVRPNRPILVVGIDAIDEKQGELLPEENLKIIRELVKIAAESKSKNGLPDLSLILTCRLKGEFTEIFRKNQSIGEDEVYYVFISDYDDDELIAAVQSFKKVGFEVRSRIATHLGADDLVGIDFKPEMFDKVLDETLTIIRHPVLWFVFSELNETEQHGCLDGSDKSLYFLGSAYLDWFRKKAASRIPYLKQGACEEALRSAASSLENPSDIGMLNDNWLEPVKTASGESQTWAKNLYREAVSAGLIVDVDTHEKTWRWRHPWFCRFLGKDNGGAK